MTYIDYVNQFWKTHQSVAFSSNEVYLYFFLLNECNSRGWENPFECPNRRIVLATGISEPTVIEVRNRLQQKGLLQFESGKKNAKSPVYYLNDLSKPLSKLLSNDLSKPLSKKANINIRLKSKDNNNSSELFKPEQEKPKKKPSKPKTEFIAPTLEQVKDYFRDKLPDWDKGTLETVEGDFERGTGSIAFRVRFPNPDGLLKHGVTGKVRMMTQMDNICLVPQKSTFEIQDFTYVYTVDSASVVKVRSFQPLERYNNYYVTQDFSPNTAIVYEGVQMMKDGITIKTDTIDMEAIRKEVELKQPIVK